MILIVMITLLIFITKSRIALLLTMGLLVLSACGGGDVGGESERPLVVTTTTIWGDVVSQIVGDEADVDVLIPRGADAHDFEPAPRDVALLHEADLVVVNGLGLEQGMSAVLEAAVADGANVLEVAPLLDPIPFTRHHDEEDHSIDDGHDHDADPHVWLDLIRVATATSHIADRLSEVDDSADWQAKADTYSRALIEADAEAARILDGVEDRRLLTNHEALGYFANRFDFEIVGVVIPGGSTLAEPSASELAALVQTMRDLGIDTIFAETTSSTRLAEAVAEEAGEDVSVVELHTESLGKPGSGADTLIGLTLSNARTVSDRLAAR